ncbi:hypothetical protein [Halorussus sp. AFM4]|uniref:hypothetical protein n=1 Tax=Halorussus sp. AFM4 TaxID=3421651 RepID=UPI003EB7EE12
MTWTCSSGVADDCREGDLFDPPHRKGEAAICTACARELGLTDSSMKQLDFRNGTPVEPDENDDQDDVDEDAEDDEQ